MTLKEEYLCPNCLTRGEHTHACQEPVAIQTMSIKEIDALHFYCVNCGRVADRENMLCQPKPLKPEGKQLFIKAAKGTGAADVCQVCGQPVSPPGHVCDAKGLPLKCEFCSQVMRAGTHVCKDILEKAEYTCKDCGRIAVRKEFLCAPVRIR